MLRPTRVLSRNVQHRTIVHTVRTSYAPYAYCSNYTGDSELKKKNNAESKMSHVIAFIATLVLAATQPSWAQVSAVVGKEKPLLGLCFVNEL